MPEVIMQETQKDKIIQPSSKSSFRMASMVRDSNLQQEEEGGTRWEGAQDVEFSRSRTNAPFKTQNTDTQTHTGIQTHIKTHTGTHPSMQGGAHACIQACTRTCIHTHVDTHIIHTCLHTRAYIHVHTYALA